MNTLSRLMIGTAVSGAIVLSAASPALARDRHHDDGIGAGEVIAGALVIGGIAALVSSGSHDRNRDYNYDRAGYDGGNWRGYDRGYERGYGNPRQAIAQCVNAAERSASRYGRANVTEVRDIDRNDRGYTVRGRIVLNGGDRGGDRGGWGRDDWRYGNSGYGRGYDDGSFRCRVEYGRITDLDFSGIRGL
ncbi:MAG: hypothetical protein ABI673_07920 [Novosphingobium sp.]